eukprot:jgi/Astpho2/4239/Aster-x0194
MGWISFTVSQVLLTSITLGALKKNGVITVEPKNIANPQLRTAFGMAVGLGEEVVIQGERFWRSLRDGLSGLGPSRGNNGRTLRH